MGNQISELVNFYEFKTKELNEYWEKAKAKAKRKKPFRSYSEFIKSIYPIEGDKKQNRIFGSDAYTETKLSKEAMKSNLTRWTGRGVYSRQPKTLFQYEVKENNGDKNYEPTSEEKGAYNAAKWIQKNYVVTVKNWLMNTFGMDEDTSYRMMLLVVRDSLGQSLVEKCLFFRAGLSCITQESVAKTIYFFLRYLITGEFPSDVDVDLCERFENDVAELKNQALIGASESREQQRSRILSLKYKGNCVVRYMFAIERYYDEALEESERIRLALDSIDELLTEKKNGEDTKVRVMEYPMPHYLRAVICKNLADKKYIKNGDEIIERVGFKNKISFYKGIVKDAEQACRYGIGGAFELLGDLLGDDKCPKTVKDDICKNIPSGFRKGDKYIRTSRHMYRFGMYCENANAALKLTELLDKNNPENLLEIKSVLKKTKECGNEVALVKYLLFVLCNEVGPKDENSFASELEKVYDEFKYNHSAGKVAAVFAEIRRNCPDVESKTRLDAVIRKMDSGIRKMIAEKAMEEMQTFAYEIRINMDDDYLEVLAQCNRE